MNIKPKGIPKPIPHLFLEEDFGGGFATKNAILDTTPFEPHVLFVGTYNPRTTVNDVDFFYGRNYFWPTMFNIFVQHNITWTRKRENTIPPFIPDLNEVLMLCAHVRMTFADLIKNTFHKKLHNRLEGNIARYDGTDYNLIDDNALAQLNALGQVEWATKDIIAYLLRTPSINCVRFTRQPDKRVWREQWNQIINANYGRRQISFGTIHTPAGRGLYEAGIPIATALARRWLHHPVAHKRLCDQWIEDNDVPVQDFNYPNPPLPLF
ncbi:hypothetical protein [Spirosoma areae]